MAHVVFLAGLAFIVGGLFWIVFTMPVSEVLAGDMTFQGDAANTVAFINLFIGAMPVFGGIVILAWGWVRTIEERETGVSAY